MAAQNSSSVTRCTGPILDCLGGFTGSQNPIWGVHPSYKTLVLWSYSCLWLRMIVTATFTISRSEMYPTSKKNSALPHSGFLHWSLVPGVGFSVNGPNTGAKMSDSFVRLCVIVLLQLRVADRLRELRPDCCRGFPLEFPLLLSGGPWNIKCLLIIIIGGYILVQGILKRCVSSYY